MMDPIFPVSELSPYHQKWTIKARVTSKSQTRTFRKGSGDGKVFSVDLLDAEGGEVRASFFNEAADMYSSVLEVGKVFRLSGGNVKIANRQYNATNNSYELSFDRNARIEADSDDTAIATIRYNFVDLRTLQSKNLPCNVDLCAVVKSYRESTSLTSKAGAELTKRDLVICDDTGNSLVLTLWGEEAKRKDSEFDGHPVVAVKGVRVSDFNERSASINNGSLVALNPSNLPEAERLKKWWAQGGSSAELHSLTTSRGGAGGLGRNAKEMSLSEVRQASTMMGSVPEFYSTVARLRMVQTSKKGEKAQLYYTACGEKKENGLPCNRKVGDDGVCQVCNKQVQTAVRLMTRCQFTDATDALWLGTFDNGAQSVLGCTGEELQKKERDGGKLETLLQPRYYAAPFRLTIRAKMETFNNENRPDCRVVDARPIPLPEHGRMMLKEVMTMVQAN